MEAPPPVLPIRRERRNAVTWKRLFIAAPVALLQLPLVLVNALRREPAENRARGIGIELMPSSGARRARRSAEVQTTRVDGVFDMDRRVERAVKHGVPVVALECAAFCLFYLALLALGEGAAPEMAYVGAAVGSSASILCYSAAILRSCRRAAIIAALLAGVHSMLLGVLRMKNFALLAGTGALFAARAGIRFCTRNVDWLAEDAGAMVRAGGAAR